MRILLSDTWAGGGASTFVATLARGLVAAGHTVDVIVGYRDSPAVADYAQEARTVFRPPVDFNRTVLRGDYDVVHVTEDDLAPPFDYARRLRRLGLRAQVVVTPHAEHARVAPAAADAVVYVSETAASAADASGGRVIANGVDASWLRETADLSLLAEEQVPAAVWVGRCLDPLRQKGYPDFLAAVPALLNRGWRVVVLDGAPDPDRRSARDLANSFGGRVTYSNQVPRAQVLGCLMEAGRSGGAFISTSRTEAAPFIALEALAVGCPVVVPRIAGYASLLTSGHATAYDGLDELIDALDNRRFTRAEAGLPLGFTASRMVELYLTVYSDLGQRRNDLSVRSRTLRTGARALTSPHIRQVRGLAARLCW